MRLTFGLVAVATVCAGLAGCGGAADPPPGAASGSTLRSTWADRDRNGVLERAPGERLLVRTDLAPASAPAGALATLGQITDAHVRDEESPARVPFLDRLGAPFNSTFRPQETLSTQVLSATVNALDAEHPQAVVDTGDLIDNDQENELGWAIGTLNGGTVRPDSGAPGYSGVQSARNPDPLYYRPSVDAPRHPGLLAAAQRPFSAPGLRAPWYPLLGNHDVLVQGELAATAQTQAVAAGDRRVTSLPGDPASLAAARRDPGAALSGLLANGLPGSTAGTPADPRRRELGAEEVARRLIAGSRHGALVRGRLDYAFDVGGVRAIVLDTIRRDSGSGGSLAATQLTWLRGALAAARERPVIVFSHQSLGGFAGGRAALSVLDRDPRVVATVAGNSHRNSIEPRRTALGGYWTITTSSLADWPMQARMLRLVRTRSGRLALETWMVDGTGNPLADTARRLAYLDAQGGRPQGYAGTRRDRNTLLMLPAERRTR